MFKLIYLPVSELDILSNKVVAIYIIFLNQKLDLKGKGHLHVSIKINVSPINLHV
jgi:hypothetical protein